MLRPATPGATKLPAGAKDRETILGLRADLDALKREVEDLKRLLADANEESKPDKAALVEEAVALGIGARSTLARWGVDKLTAAIAEAKEA